MPRGSFQSPQGSPRSQRRAPPTVLEQAGAFHSEQFVIPHVEAIISGGQVYLHDSNVIRLPYSLSFGEWRGHLPHLWHRQDEYFYIKRKNRAVTKRWREAALAFRLSGLCERPSTHQFASFDIPKRRVPHSRPLYQHSSCLICSPISAMAGKLTRPY